jgi:hypothetical protein
MQAWRGGGQEGGHDADTVIPARQEHESAIAHGAEGGAGGSPLGLHGLGPGQQAGDGGGLHQEQQSEAQPGVPQAADRAGQQQGERWQCEGEVADLNRQGMAGQPHKEKAERRAPRRQSEQRPGAGPPHPPPTQERQNKKECEQ